MKEELSGKSLDTGEAIVTKGYNLPSKYIIHTAGPRYKDGTKGERTLLKKTYTSCLEAAKKNGIKSITFCSISTGAFRFPLHEAAEIAVQTILEWQKKEDYEIDIYFTFIDNRSLEAYKKALSEYKDDTSKTVEKAENLPVFNIGQKIQHPKFGEGEIINVTENTLTIKFGVGEKTLSTAWVSDKCRIM